MANNLSDDEIEQIFVDELKLCRVKPGEDVVILRESKSLTPYVSPCWKAVEVLGANVCEITIPAYQVSLVPNHNSLQRRKKPFFPSTAVIEALKRVNMIIDLTEETITHAREKEEILEAGVRILTIKEPPSVLKRMFPSEELKRTVVTARNQLQRAERMRVTSKAGTNFTAIVKQVPVGMQYGFVDMPGRWDHCPGGFVTCYPKDAEGEIVLDTGDCLLPPNRYINDPVGLTVTSGYIRNIDGGLDADFLKNYMESWNDPEVFAISHVGWGLDKTAQWSALAMEKDTFGMDARSFAGNFMWSTGTNRFIGRFAACHFDIPMRNCTVEVDGKVVVREGVVVEEGQG